MKIKQINTNILNNIGKYNYFPENKKQLRELLIYLIEERGNESIFNDIDTSNITNMEYLFKYFDEFNDDISEWNVSNVKNMNGMFFGCEKFNCLLNNWNVSNVVNMKEMFWGCEKFDNPLDKWNIKKVKNMTLMFQHCGSFDQDLSSWDVKNKKHDFMFEFSAISEEHLPKNFL